MHFADKAEIFVKAGDGGNGSASFRREKYIAKGGPDGGNGGNGGNIILEADENINTLANFLGKKHYKANSGFMGLGRKMNGADAEDEILKVPVGTLVYDKKTDELLVDLNKNKQIFIIAKGGLGGKGNVGFTSSVRQSPDFAELGEPGESREIRLSLKLIADIAIIGYPSVGKSTLISRISNARPKIADYPFTTLIPNLGTVKVDNIDFVVADIPGLIEGAHKGKGLGIEFLRHIERAKILLHILDITRDDLLNDYKTLNKELKSFSKELAKKEQILVVSKLDSTIPEIIEDIKKKFNNKNLIFISAVTGEGIKELLYVLKDAVIKNRKKIITNETKVDKKEEYKIFRPHLNISETRNYEIEKIQEDDESDNLKFRITGKRIEQIAIMTDVSKRGAIIRFNDILKKIGAKQKLIKLGAKIGDKIYVSERVFDFIED